MYKNSTVRFIDSVMILFMISNHVDAESSSSEKSSKRLASLCAECKSPRRKTLESLEVPIGSHQARKIVNKLPNLHTRLARVL